MSGRLAIFLLLISLLLLTLTPPSLSNHHNDAEEEDLSFLDEDDVKTDHLDSQTEDEGGGGSCVGGGSGSTVETHEEPPKWPDVDEKDVVVLNQKNFTDAMANNKHVLVEFYAPWCGHCQTLAPEYAATATELKVSGVDVVVAKVDATVEKEIAKTYEVQGFPTILFFVDGERKMYNGQRTKDAIVRWIKKKTGPSVYTLSTTEEAKKILSSSSSSSGTPVVLAYLESLEGPDSKEFESASKSEDEVNFYQTLDSSVAKLFHIDIAARKRPAMVLLKQEAEKISQFDDCKEEFSKSAISKFVADNKLPLVISYSEDKAQLVFENPTGKLIWLFANLKDSENLIPKFQEAAKSFKGKIMFVYVPLDNKELAQPIAEIFGIKGDIPQVAALLGMEQGSKYIFDGELTSDKIKAFAEDFLAEKLEPFYKSDPIPETNDGYVKIVVGHSFDQIVLDDSKDVLLEIYASWCGYCQRLEPIYNQLGKSLKGIESLVIAKMDGTSNEHPRIKVEGFPTLLFFPAGKNNSDPIEADMEPTVKDLYKFIKEHASIPFNLQKKTYEEDGSADSSYNEKESSLKDEL